MWFIYPKIAVNSARGVRTPKIVLQAKPEKRNLWGSRLLAGMKIKGKSKKSSPGQMRLPWDNQKVTESTEVHEVARIFIEANCYNPSVPGNEIRK